jgi:hypothetical protein
VEVSLEVVRMPALRVFRRRCRPLLREEAALVRQVLDRWTESGRIRPGPLVRHDATLQRETGEEGCILPHLGEGTGDDCLPTTELRTVEASGSGQTLAPWSPRPSAPQVQGSVWTRRATGTDTLAPCVGTARNWLPSKGPLPRRESRSSGARTADRRAGLRGGL